LLTAGVRRGGERSYREVDKPLVFSGEAGKVSGFITACKLYMKAGMMGATVEEQVQWMLSFIQGGLVDIWKLKDLEEEVLLRMMPSRYSMDLDKR